MVASATPLPVIGVPVPLKYLDGMDSLLSIVQMPAGVPVATVSIGGARNAGLLAVRILGASDLALQQQMVAFRTGSRRWSWTRTRHCATSCWAEYPAPVKRSRGVPMIRASRGTPVRGDHTARVGVCPAVGRPHHVRRRVRHLRVQRDAGWVRARGTTIGGAFLTGRDPARALVRHEAVHADQWAAYGWTFALRYLFEELRHRGSRNRFEIAAGLADGGYRES